MERVVAGIVPTIHILIPDFPCAWAKKLLIQGRLYVTENNLCFYSKIMTWTCRQIIPFERIVGVEKKAVCGLFQNAIEISTQDQKVFPPLYWLMEFIFEYLF
jgi:hypothetical protein